MELNISLSPGQASFAALLAERVPYLLPLFDFSERAYLQDEVEKFLAAASHGEAIMARFFLSIWRHADEFDFDFIDAAATLDKGQMKVITDWLEKPFWP